MLPTIYTVQLLELEKRLGHLFLRHEHWLAVRFDAS